MKSLQLFKSVAVLYLWMSSRTYLQQAGEIRGYHGGLRDSDDGPSSETLHKPSSLYISSASLPPSPEPLSWAPYRTELDAGEKAYGQEAFIFTVQSSFEESQSYLRYSDCNVY